MINNLKLMGNTQAISSFFHKIVSVDLRLFKIYDTLIFSYIILGLGLIAFGRAFAQALPIFIWLWIAAGALLSFFVAQQHLGKKICWLIFAALSISFMIDFIQSYPLISLKIKSLQRMATYIFPFFVVLSYQWGKSLKTRFPSLSGTTKRILIIIAMVVALFEIFGIYSMSHGCTNRLMLALGLVAIIGVRVEKRFEWEKNLFFTAVETELFLVFLTGMTVGSGRSMLLAWSAAITYFGFKYHSRKPYFLLSIFLCYLLGISCGALNQSVLTEERDNQAVTRLSNSFGTKGAVYKLLTSKSEKLSENGGVTSLAPKTDNAASTSNFFWRLLVWKDAYLQWSDQIITGIGFKSKFSSPLVKAAYPHSVVNYEDLDLHNSWLQLFLRGGLILGIPFLIFWFLLFKWVSPGYRMILVFFSTYSMAVVGLESPYFSLPIYLSGFVLPLIEPERSL